ncbi:MAG: type II toxin-antitoxin system RelE/ParE family toxin [Candidatus Hydrogenedentota bacterium]
MHYPVLWRPEAEADLDAISFYLAQSGLDAALRFLDKVEETTQLISQHPDVGARPAGPRSESRSTRFLRIKGFQAYLLFYEREDDSLYVIRVVHSAQDYVRLI